MVCAGDPFSLEHKLLTQLRHDQQSVAMALAEASHHSAPRRPKTARAGERLEDPEPGRETGTEASVRGAVAGHACAGWRARAHCPLLPPPAVA